MLSIFRTQEQLIFVILHVISAEVRAEKHEYMLLVNNAIHLQTHFGPTIIFGNINYTSRVRFSHKNWKYWAESQVISKITPCAAWTHL